MEPVEAIKASYSFVTGNLGPTVLYYLLGLLVVIAGAILCNRPAGRGPIRRSSAQRTPSASSRDTRSPRLTARVGRPLVRRPTPVRLVGRPVTRRPAPPAQPAQRLGSRPSLCISVGRPTTAPPSGGRGGWSGRAGSPLQVSSQPGRGTDPCPGHPERRGGEPTVEVLGHPLIGGRCPAEVTPRVAGISMAPLYSRGASVSPFTAFLTQAHGVQDQVETVPLRDPDRQPCG